MMRLLLVGLAPFGLVPLLLLLVVDTFTPFAPPAGGGAVACAAVLGEAAAVAVTDVDADCAAPVLEAA